MVAHSPRRRIGGKKRDVSSTNRANEGRACPGSRLCAQTGFRTGSAHQGHGGRGHCAQCRNWEGMDSRAETETQRGTKETLGREKASGQRVKHWPPSVRVLTSLH